MIARRRLLFLKPLTGPTGTDMSESNEIQRKSLLNAALAAAASVERVEIHQIELPPGQAVGLHRHPCPVVGYVVAGAINFQDRKSVV